MTVLKASDIGFGSTPDPVKERIFQARGDQRYTYTLKPAGIVFEVQRLIRHRDGLVGELSVAVNGTFPHAKTSKGGYLSIGDLNFSSVSARGTRAKLLADRSRVESLDWHGFLEEFAIEILGAERRGEPSVVLADYPVTPGDSDSWEFDGFPVLRRHPTVLFGKGASGKSYFAIWIAGQLSLLGIPVLYLDWELAAEEHKKRLLSLFQPAPKTVHYVRCKHPLRESIERIDRLRRELNAHYAVFDSVGPASRQSGGRFQDGDIGQEYFGLVRELGIGSLHVAHPPKHTEDEKDSTVFGSAFFSYLARSIWFVKATENNPAGQISMGLYHHKLTTGPRLEPKAYTLTFQNERTVVTPTSLQANEELVDGLPLLDRMKRALQDEPLSTADLAEELNVSVATVRAMASRYKSLFSRAGKRIAVRTDVEF